MLKTERLVKLCPVVAFLVIAFGLFLAGTSHGQTIAELAELQRAKLVAEIAKPKSDVEVPKPQFNVQELAKHKLATSSSGLTVHSTFSKGGVVYKAELTDGKNLFTANPGEVFGPNRIVAITSAGVQVENDHCKKECNKITLVVIGGAF